MIFRVSNMEIRNATENDRKTALEFMRKHYFPYKPLAMEIINRDEKNCEEYEYYVTRTLQNPSLNLIASSNGEIIGVSLNKAITKEDYYKSLKLPVSNDENFHFTIKFWMHVKDEANVFGHYPEVNEAFVISATCVHQDFMDRGLAEMLINKSILKAKEMGYKLVFTYLTNATLSSVVEKLGFKLIYHLKYEDFKINGETFLSRSYPYDGAHVYAIRIDEKI